MNSETLDLSSSRRELRRSLRHARRQLSPLQQSIAARQLYERLVHDKLFLKARRVAFYMAADGEIDPELLLVKALEMGKKCFLPVLSPHRPSRISFAPIAIGTTLVANRWGIPEPVSLITNHVPARSLNLVLVPLVGFDEQGGRLGMGKGYYDRSFAFKKRLGSNKPTLLGLAHECQKVQSLPLQAWDVPLDAVVSDEAVYR